MIARPEMQASLLCSDNDGGRSAIEIIRSGLETEERALFDAEFAGLPETMVLSIGDLVARSAKEGLRFSFRSTIPDSVMEVARARRVSFSFDIEEDGISVTMVHTLRHPTWLPQVDVRQLTTA